MMDPTVQELQRRVAALEEQLAQSARAAGASTGLIRAFLGRIEHKEGDRCRVTPLTGGDPVNWGDGTPGSFDELDFETDVEHMECGAWKGKDVLVAPGITPAIVLRLANCPRAVVIPLRADWSTEYPNCEPDESDVEEPDPPNDCDPNEGDTDINCPHGL